MTQPQAHTRIHLVIDKQLGCLAAAGHATQCVATLVVVLRPHAPSDCTHVVSVQPTQRHPAGHMASMLCHACVPCRIVQAPQQRRGHDCWQSDRLSQSWVSVPCCTQFDKNTGIFVHCGRQHAGQTFRLSACTTVLSAAHTNSTLGLASRLAPEPQPLCSTCCR